MSLGDSVIQDLTFSELLFVLVIGWMLVTLWQRYIDNLTFNTLKLDEDSAYQTFIIALVATVIFLLFIFSFNNIYGGLVESTITGGAVTGGTVTGGATSGGSPDTEFTDDMSLINKYYESYINNDENYIHIF